MSLLLNLVRKAELSRSEVQILIDLLLNKQHEAPAILDEWTEVNIIIKTYKNTNQFCYFFKYMVGQN